MKKYFFFIVFLFLFSFIKVNASFEDVHVGDFFVRGSVLSFDVDNNNNYVFFYVNNNDELKKMVLYTYIENDHKTNDFCSGFQNYGGLFCEATTVYENNNISPKEYEGFIIQSIDNAIDVCSSYSEIKDQEVCQNIINGSDGKNYHSVLVKYWSYSDASYDLICDDTVSLNEAISCEFYASFYLSVENVSFEFVGDNYEIVSMNFAEGITKENELNKSFSISRGDGIRHLYYMNEPLLSFEIKPKENYVGQLDVLLDFLVIYLPPASEGPDSFSNEISTSVNVTDLFLESPYAMKCSNDSLTKGSKVDCSMSVDTNYPIKTIVVEFDISKYSFIDYDGSNGWKIIDTKLDDNKVYYTLEYENGFDGNDDFFVFTLELKDNVDPGFIVKTDNIHYTLTNDIEYDANTSDSLIGKEVNNPETMDKIFILFMILLGAIGVTFVFVSQLLMKRLV